MTLTQSLDIYERLLETKHCSLATASRRGSPSVAQMLFCRFGLYDLVLHTFNDSEKFQNLSVNPKASMTIYDAGDYAQMKGRVNFLGDGESEVARDVFIAKYGVCPSLDDPRMRYFVFDPLKIKVRLTREYPWEYVVLRDER